jgi:hypothetical protein
MPYSVKVTLDPWSWTCVNAPRRSTSAFWIDHLRHDDASLGVPFLFEAITMLPVLHVVYGCNIYFVGIYTERIARETAQLMPSPQGRPNMFLTLFLKIVNFSCMTAGNVPRSYITSENSIRALQHRDIGD